MQRFTMRWAVAVLVVSGLGADWPGFRGPKGAASSPATGLPAEWSGEKNLAWKTTLPGHGASSPITHGGRIYLTCYSGYALDSGEPGEPGNLMRHVLCLNEANGKEIWRKEIRSQEAEPEYRGFLTQHGYASSTPATDGQRLYVFLGAAGVVAFDLDGKQLWQTSVGTGTDNWGSGTSPVVFGDLVIVNASVESGAVVALDAASGEKRWQFPGVRRSWSTPALVETNEGKTELVASYQGTVVGLDPQSGKALWRCRGIQDYVCPSVVPGKGVVYVTGGRQSTLLAIRAGGQGDVTSGNLLWSAKVGANVVTPVLYEGHLYGFNEQGIAYCVEADSGAVKFQERLSLGGAPAGQGGAGKAAGKGRSGRGGGGPQIYASPIAADGKVYIVTRKQGVFVLAAKPKFDVVTHNRFDDPSDFEATPAISNGRLLIRSNQALYAVSAAR